MTFFFGLQKNLWSSKNKERRKERKIEENRRKNSSIFIFGQKNNRPVYQRADCFLVFLPVNRADEHNLPVPRAAERVVIRLTCVINFQKKLKIFKFGVVRAKARTKTSEGPKIAGYQTGDFWTRATAFSINESARAAARASPSEARTVQIQSEGQNFAAFSKAAKF